MSWRPWQGRDSKDLGPGSENHPVADEGQAAAGSRLPTGAGGLGGQVEKYCRYQ